MTQQIIINGRFLDQPFTGVQRYAREITRTIDQLIDANDPAVSGLRFSIARPKSGNAPSRFRHIKEARFGRLSGHAWEQLELPLHTGSTLLLNLCNLCPVLGRRNLTVVHDANVWLIPDNYSSMFRAVYHILIPLGIRRSRVWITVSQYSADQLLARHLANRPPYAIIGNGSDHMSPTSADSSELRQASLPLPFVFALGSRSRNKNIDLIRSMAPGLKAKGISIVIAGDAKTRVFTEQEAAQAINIIELGRVSDSDLAYLFRTCLCFVFPSFFEGFGIPPLEAMAMGAPVISSNTSSLPEILGDAALYCDPGNLSSWVEAVTQLATDKSLRADLISKGTTQAAKYQWKNPALRLVEAARSALAKQ